MCRTESRQHSRTNVVGLEEETEQEVWHFVNTARSCYEVSLEVEGRPLQMQIDTGAAVTIVPEGVYKATFPHVKCTPSRVSLRTYTGEQLQLKGQCEVVVNHNAQRMTLPVVVVKDEGRRLPVLLGRDWLERLKLDWHGIGNVRCEDRNFTPCSLVNWANYGVLKRKFFSGKAARQCFAALDRSLSQYESP